MVVLGTTVGIDLLTSSNETVVYSASFGDDTIVYFAATGNGIDLLAQIAASPVFIGAELLQTVLDLAGE